MGKDLSQWNKKAMDLLTEAAFFFFPVNVFKSCRSKYPNLSKRPDISSKSALHSGLGPWVALQVSLSVFIQDRT
jgi:hypothetical protein